MTAKIVRHKWRKLYKGMTYTHCAVCGIVRTKNRRNKPCKGPARLRDLERPQAEQGEG